MILPFPVLVRSHIQKRKKFALLGLLALGTFITIIQVIRIQTVKSLSNYLDSARLVMWSTVENNLGIIYRRWHRSSSTMPKSRKRAPQQLSESIAITIRLEVTT